MNIRNLKVAARLFLAFGTIAVIFAAALGLSIQRLTEFKNEVHGLTNDRVPKLEQTDDWTIRLLETARHTRNMLILDDKEKIQKELDAVQEDKAKRKEYMELLTASAATAEEKAALQVVLDARTAYLPLEDEYLHQVTAGQLKKPRDAAGTGAAGSNVLPRSPEQISRLPDGTNQGSGGGAGQQLRAHSRHAADALRFAAAAATVLVMMISRAIVAPLKRVIAHFDELRRGHFDGVIDVHSTDETGQLLSALKTCRRRSSRTNGLRRSPRARSRRSTSRRRRSSSISTAPSGRRTTISCGHGYSFADVKDQNHGMFVEPAHRSSPEYRRSGTSWAEGEHQADQYKRIGRDGREIWLQASYNPSWASTESHT